ncbi:sensor histidine kinase [Maribacter halichondriae]|uniref:sensor histidine kinase n=1 Tax=Maribacter halichondriae TaxID=2980554 RepID=UPI0023585451|nr:histidine kinase [Maribacter sp. Hal144]
MKIRKQQWKYHIVLLTVIVIMDMFSFYVLNTSDDFFRKLRYPYFLYLISFYVVFFLVYFLNYYLICPRTIAKKKILHFIVAILLLFLVYSSIRYVLDEILLFNITGIHNYFESSRALGYYVMDNSYYATKALLFSTSLYLLFEFIENNIKINRLQLEHKKAELSLLKTQLEPHFLFNTLNTFYTELVDTRPETAKDIHRLSQLLRYVTYETHQDFMPLSRELQFVADYIHFQKKRFEDNMFLDYEIHGAIQDQPFPTFVLIHFVENIFKHGILNDKRHPAKLTIRITDQEITVLTRNKISTTEKYSKKVSEK